MPHTTVPVSEPLSRPGAEAIEVHALAIAWSKEEPQRVGEIAVLPLRHPHVLGRGDEPTKELRVRFAQQRPGRFELGEPLAGAGLSRRQLVIEVTENSLVVESVGKCPMRVNGARRLKATLVPGDTIALHGQLVLVYVRRPVVFPKASHFPPEAWRAFGDADASGIVGESAAAWQLREQLAFAAQSPTHVLLVGASGTGKELCARAIHRMSERSSRSLVTRNAATFPPGLIDAELFGNAKNYPNPGTPERAGLVGQADGGTLFLDEIAELPHEQQAHLLRVLDAGGEYQRLGEPVARRSDLRLVAATNRDPSVLKQDFRARFATVVLLAPLAARREDLPLLARHIVLQAAAKGGAAARFVNEEHGGRPRTRLSQRFVDAVVRHALPCNTRDVEAAIWQAMSEAESDEIGPPSRWPGEEAIVLGAGSPASSVRAAPHVAAEPSEAEIRQALASAGGSVLRAAPELRLSRFKLYRLMKKHDIKEPGSK